MYFSTSKITKKRQSLNYIFPLLQQKFPQKKKAIEFQDILSVKNEQGEFLRVKIFAIFGPFYSKISEYDFLQHFLGILMTVLV